MELTTLIIKDYIYQQFKYDFSLYINEFYNKNNKKTLIKQIKNPNLSIITQINNIKNVIFDTMKNIISNKLNKITKIDKGLYLGACYKSVKKSCNKSTLCDFDEKDNKCKINMDQQYLDLFSFYLANDLNNDSVQRDIVLSGSYIPSPFLSKNIFTREDDIIFHDLDIKNLKNYFFSKFQKNYNLYDDSYYSKKMIDVDSADNFIRSFIKKKVIFDQDDYDENF